MLEANHLLFEKLFQGQPLFKNQVDLVQKLLGTPAYYVSSDEPDLRTKALNRLKAYISQLLSGNANRTITHDLRESLSILVEERIPDVKEREDFLDMVFDDMKRKNNAGGVKTNKLPYTNSFEKDFAEANYITIITANTVKVNVKKHETISMSITDFFLFDLLETIFIQKSLRKKYRFNFPIKNDCYVFWRGFESGLAKVLTKMIDQFDIPDQLYEDSFLIKTPTHTLFTKYQQLRTQQIESTSLASLRADLVQVIASDMVESLNRNKIIMTFHVEEPIYSFPLVALNPHTSSETTLYAMIEDQHSEVSIIKCSNENMLLWRRFVWNHLLVSKHSHNIPCKYY